jgi:hypothetical protein
MRCLKQITELQYKRRSTRDTHIFYLKRNQLQQNISLQDSKLRVVFDAATPFQGKCLNYAILSNPAIQPSLPSVLIQLREGEIAWASDVETMFSDFRLNPLGVDYFCFHLQDSYFKPVVCRMDRLPLN